MPSTPSNPYCLELGCKNPKSKFNRFCMEHGGKDKQIFKTKRDSQRWENNAKYNTKQWETLRQIQLSRYPLCAGCEAEGIVTAANTVDHVFPWTHISEEAFFINLFQSLCPTHHATKTQLEQRGRYKRFGKPSIEYVKADYARILGFDPSNRG